MKIKQLINAGPGLYATAEEVNGHHVLTVEVFGHRRTDALAGFEQSEKGRGVSNITICMYRQIYRQIDRQIDREIEK